MVISDPMSKSIGKWVLVWTGIVAAALAGVMLIATDGEAQRRQPHGRTAFVRATAGNITINLPIRDAGEEGSPQALLGSTWACTAERASATEVAVSCASGAASISYRRAQCEALTVSLASRGGPTYELQMGCE